MMTYVSTCPSLQSNLLELEPGCCWLADRLESGPVASRDFICMQCVSTVRSDFPVCILDTMQMCSIANIHTGVLHVLRRMAGRHPLQHVQAGLPQSIANLTVVLLMAPVLLFYAEILGSHNMISPKSSAVTDQDRSVPYRVLGKSEEILALCNT